MHVPVLLDEVLALLKPRAGGVYVDGTLGEGGHAEAILKASDPDGILIGFDWDDRAVDMAAERLKGYGERVRLVRGNYAEMASVLSGMGLSGKVNGVMLDLGMSSMQLADPARGFSFQTGGILDMRMSSALPETAASLVNRLSEEELAGIIYKYGEERRSRAIARAVVRARALSHLRTVEELTDIVCRVVRMRRRGRIHPATRTFQALRIAVNRELENLKAGLAAGRSVLCRGGVLAVISFHSLEDRIVKQAFREWGAAGFRPQSRRTVERRTGDENKPVCSPAVFCSTAHLSATGQGFVILTRKPITPCEDEVFKNPRSRSAKLRAIMRRAD